MVVSHRVSKNSRISCLGKISKISYAVFVEKYVSLPFVIFFVLSGMTFLCKLHFLDIMVNVNIFKANPCAN